MSYLDEYRASIDKRVAEDPKMAVGGRWEEVGKWQFDLLVRGGLARHHSLLDIGCGTLRGGRHFIWYLDPEKYAGLELSERALEAAAELVAAESLSDRRPRLVFNTNGRLDFRQFADEKFDFILAQSVFTHLPPDLIAECLDHLPNIMRADSVFYFTFNEAASSYRAKFNAWKYSWSFLQELCQVYGLMASREDLTDEQRHPRSLVAVNVRLDCSLKDDPHLTQ